MKLDLNISAFDRSLSSVAADKSLSHRAALFSLLADDTCWVKNYLFTGDCLNTLEFIKALGAKVEQDGEWLKITPPEQIVSPDRVLDCGNAGTLMRLAVGLLASIEGDFVLSGDEYLNARPMKRVSGFLNSAGAKIFGRDDGNFAPLYIRGTKLDFFELNNEKLSAQVKSAALLAGLLSNGCVVRESELTREHTEQLLYKMGAPINTKKIAAGYEISVEPLSGQKLKSYRQVIGNDPSSAFFFAALCAIVPESKLSIENMLINPTRIEAFKVLERMGVQLKISPNADDDKLGIINLKSPKKLKAVEVSEHIAWLIDELPALAVVMAHADGCSVVKNAAELRVKESDRIKATVNNLRAFGVNCKELDDGFVIDTKGFSLGADINHAHEFVQIKSYGDHRIAMAFSLCSAHTAVQIDDASCVSVSFSNFFDLLKSFCNES